MHRAMLLVCLLSLGVGAAIGGETPAVAPDPEKVKQAEQFIKAMGSDEYQAREEAAKNLLDLGDAALPALEDAVKNTQDPEVRTRAQELAKRIKTFRTFGQLTEKEREAVQVEFQTDFQGGQTANYRMENKAGFGLFDLGDVRVAVEGLELPGGAGQMYVDAPEGLGSSSMQGSMNFQLKMETTNGLTTVSLNGVTFKVVKAVVSVETQNVPLGKGKVVIFMTKEGKLSKLVEVPKK